jgi:transposase
MDKYIGFDVSDKSVVACVLQGKDRPRFAKLPMDLGVLRTWLEREAQGGVAVRLTFEVSGTAGWLHDGLVDAVTALVVCNPREMKWIYRTRKKTDRIDAEKMARLFQAGLLPTVHLPGVSVRVWRQLIQHRRQLMNSAVQVKNRIRMHAKSRGYRRPGVGRNWWTKGNRQWLTTTFAADLVMMNYLGQLSLLADQIMTATVKLDARLAADAGGVLLQSIPGIGPRTAEAILAYTDDISRFRSGREYASYFGLTPRLDESGPVSRFGHISKCGPSVVRWLLCESSWRAVAKSPSLRAFYEQVRQGSQERKKIAVVAVARKLLTIIRAMLLTGEVFNEALVSAPLAQAS